MKDSIRHFHTKVVGVTHKNPNGKSRQSILKKCKPLELLELEHDDENPHDANAVRVCRGNGEQIGFLNARLASEVVCKAGRGYRYGAYVKNVTGGRGRTPTMGLNLLIVVADPGVGDADVQRFVNRLDLSDADAPRSGGGNLRTLVVLALIVAVVAVFIGECS